MSVLLDLVRRQLDAYNNRDLDAFVACYHPEVTVIRLLTGETTDSGIEEFRAGYKLLFDSNPNLHCELKSRIVLADAVIDEEWVTGVSKYPNGLHAVAIYTCQDGLINRVWFPQ